MIFGKVPEPGRTKTRLAPVLGEEGAATLYEAFLKDVVDRCREVEAERELWVPRRPGAAARLGRRFPGLTVRWQAGDDLGERLRAAFGRAFGEGARRALVVGSDHPTLPGNLLARAFDALDEARAVVGATRDGGYYALALRADAWPEGETLFRAVPWSTSRVLEATLQRAREAGVQVARLPTWYDVDEPGELERLLGDVRPGSATARALSELGLGAG